MSDNEANEEKARLAMVRRETMTLDDWLRLFEFLTGRQPTAEDIAELKAEMAKDDVTPHTRADGS